MKLNDQFSLLHFKNNQEWRPLPGWARFFLGLGESLASTNSEKTRYTVALALPTRSYATAFISSGYACTNLIFRSYEDIEYIKFIQLLPEGTSVKFIENGKIKKGIKRDLHEYDGAMHVGIQIEGSAIKYILPQNVRNIEVANQNYNDLPDHQKGRSIIPPSDLLNTLFPSKANEYTYRTRIDGVVVGSRTILIEESLLPLAILSKDRKQEFQGNLHDMFRVEDFNPKSTGHRFLMQTSNNNDPPAGPLGNLTPNSVVIFDGALGFVKWKEMYKNHNWIVVLDHTNPNFPDAVSQINQEYSYKSEGVIKPSLPMPLSGMEMMFFERNI